jgi:hypothetical protein
MWLVRSFCLAALLAGATAGGAGAAEHRLGLGYLYWQALDDIESARIEEDGAAPFLTYQYVPEGIFRLELDLEYYADGFGGSDEPTYSPSVYALVEFGLYAGVGAGFTASSYDGGGVLDFVYDPFYVVRLGWDFQVVPRLHVDLHANYRVGGLRASASEDLDSDSVTLGAAARVAF